MDIYTLYNQVPKQNPLIIIRVDIKKNTVGIHRNTPHQLNVDTNEKHKDNIKTYT